jgi:hypothetical protein
MKRRQLLHLAGAGFVVALSGCSGNGSGNGDNPETESQSSTQTSTATSTEDQETTETGGETSTSETESGEERYPTQENDGRFERIMERRAEEWDGFYAFEIDDYQYINTEGVEPGSEADTYSSYDVALSTAANLEVNGEQSDNILFWVGPVNQEDWDVGNESSPGAIFMYVNCGDWDQLQLDGRVRGYPEKFRPADVNAEPDVDPTAVQEALTVFFTEHIDGNGIVDHAGEVPDYAHEAFNTGWLAD